MKIQKIELADFRNYESLTLRPGDGINLFFGRNGSGKTNLLEAIHYCALGRSHRVSGDQNVVRIGKKAAGCSVSVQTRLTRHDISVHLQPGESGKKTIYIDQTRAKRFSELMGCLRLVIFSPEDPGMIRGGPSLRRRFLDMMISQLSKPYFIALQQYKSAMDQRNAILKDSRVLQQRIDPMIEDFEEAMTASAVQIFESRSRLIDQLASSSLETYHRVSGREEENFQLSYRCGFKNSDDPGESLRKSLRENREEDRRLGFTSSGPHRDDIYMSLNKKDLKLFASQGQVRTAALSIKLSQLEVLTRDGGDRPVLLLDDVMSELDQVRRMNLLKEIGDTQTFVTCSDETDLADFRDCRAYAVMNENGNASLRETNRGIYDPEPILAEPDFSL